MKVGYVEMYLMGFCVHMWSSRIISSMYYISDGFITWNVNQIKVQKQIYILFLNRYTCSKTDWLSPFVTMLPTFGPYLFNGSVRA